MNLSQFIPDNSEQDYFKSPILRIRGKCLYFGNVIYQIHNISSIGFVNLTTERKMPKFYWGLVGLGGVIFLGSISGKSGGGILIGLILLGLGIYLIYQHNVNKINERYGMTIYTNSGNKSILTSKEESFILRAILTLSNVMNTEEPTALTMNFANCDILPDKSTKIDNNIGSPIVNSDIKGDLINNVDAY